MPRSPSYGSGRRSSCVKPNFSCSVPSPIVIAGAGILPETFTRNNVVLNVHPGWLPTVRGLDSLKWAIYRGDPIGVTVHVCDGEVDRGKYIYREEVPVSPMDSLQSLWLRLYDRGLDLLEQAVVTGAWSDAKEYGEPAMSPTRRMDHVTELVMMKRFEAMKF